MNKREHVNDSGEFQSDKYPSCPAGKVPLSTKDKSAQDLLWNYAQRRRSVDHAFADDLEFVLLGKGYRPLPIYSESKLLRLVTNGVVNTPAWFNELREAATETCNIIASLQSQLEVAKAETEKLEQERSTWRNADVLGQNTKLLQSSSELARKMERFRQGARELADKWEQQSNQVDPISRVSQPISTSVRRVVSASHATDLRVLISESFSS